MGITVLRRAKIQTLFVLPNRNCKDFNNGFWNADLTDLADFHGYISENQQKPRNQCSKPCNLFAACKHTKKVSKLRL